jgi:hypothetical protein
MGNNTRRAGDKMTLTTNTNQGVTTGTNVEDSTQVYQYSDDMLVIDFKTLCKILADHETRIYNLENPH